jgi:hypothetical protein
MAPQQLASTVVTTTSPYTGPPVDSIDEVIDRLEQIQTYAEAHEPRGQHDGVACFSYLYSRITKRVLEGIGSGRFDDSQFVNLLDVVFANRYLAALRASVLSPDDVPDAWAVLFQRRSHRHITGLQFAAAGVNAHVNFDLAVAVAETCTQLGAAPDRGARHQSYREHFESTWERLIDRIVLGRVVNKIDDWIVIATRDVAWENAELLWNIRQRGDDETGFIAGMDAVAGEAGWLVLRPVF